MPYNRKNPPTLNELDLTIKRLIEFHPATIADIAHILRLTSNQVRNTIIKLEQRNEVISHLQIDSAGRRNIYFPRVPLDRGPIASAKAFIRKQLNDQWNDVEDKVSLLVEVDKAFKMLYTGVAGLMEMRRDNSE